MVNAWLVLRRNWGLRRVLAWVVTCCLSACGDALPPSGNPLIQGQVQGGQQPIVGSSVLVFAASGQSASAPTFLGSTSTDASGTFSLAAFQATPATGDLIYAVALGGDAGNGSNNANIALITVAGLYGSAMSSVQINELTTAASVTVLSPYMFQVPCSTLTGASSSSSCPQIIGSAAGWSTALSSIKALVDPSTGAMATSNATNAQNINLQASVLANCVNSAGGTANDPTACGQLMPNANTALTVLSSSVSSSIPVEFFEVSTLGDFLYAWGNNNAVYLLGMDHGVLSSTSSSVFDSSYVFSAMAVSSDGKYLAMLNNGGGFTVFQKISSDGGYLLSPVTGNLNSSSVVPSLGGSLNQIRFSHDGSQLFISDTDGLNIISYAVSNGLPVVSSERYTALDASSLSDFVLSADDRYMYVADDSQGTITVYQNSNQTLTPIQGTAQAPSFSAGIRPNVLRLSSDGQYLYAFQIGVSSGTLASFSVQAGQLNALATASVASGNIVDISLSPNGQYMAVASESADADFLSLYQLNQGQMTLVTSMSLSTPSALRSIRFSPNGQYIYAMVTDSRSSISGSIYTCAGPSQAATDTLGALLNAHSTPAKGAQTLFNLRPDQPVFTPMPASQPSTLVVVP